MTELAEGARLEIVCSAKSGTVGSNPTLSAIINYRAQINADFCRIEKISLRPNEPYDSRVLRNGKLPTPSGPEGSSGRNDFRVPQGSLAIILLLNGECLI